MTAQFAWLKRSDPSLLLISHTSRMKWRRKRSPSLPPLLENFSVGSIQTNPSLARFLKNLSGVRFLVRTSATISVVGIYCKFTSPPESISRMKWCLKSICFERLLCIEFALSKTAPWLSHDKVIGCRTFFFTDGILSKFSSHLSSCHAAEHAIHSASVLDSATVGCFLLFHEMQVPATTNATTTKMK